MTEEERKKLEKEFWERMGDPDKFCDEYIETRVALCRIIAALVFIMADIRAHSSYDRYRERIKELEVMFDKLGGHGGDARFAPKGD